MKDFGILLLEIILEVVIMMLGFYIAVTWLQSNYLFVVVDELLTSIIMTWLWYYIFKR